MKRPKAYFDQKDLYSTLKTDLLNYPLKKRYKKRHAVAGCIFAACLYEILLDIINNNVTFVLPGHQHTELYIEAIEGEKFKEMYREGWFGNLDYVLSEMKGHCIKFRYNIGKKGKSRIVKLDEKLTDLIARNSEKGKY